MSDDLSALLPGREVTVKGETLVLMPFFFGQLPRAVKLIQPLASALMAANVASFDGTTMRLAADWPLKVPAIVADGGEALLDLLAFITGKPRAWFDTLGVDEGIALTRAALEVNGDFFVAKVAPMLPVAISPDGAPSSPGSLTAGTAGATSSTTP
jgi:hypothetical protein